MVSQLPALLCPLQTHFPLPGWGSGSFGFCLQMWPVLHTQQVKSTLRLCGVAKETLSSEGEVCTQHRKHRGLGPHGRCGRRNSTPKAAELLGTRCFPSVQTEKLSPGEKVTKVLSQLVIVFSMSCSKSAYGERCLRLPSSNVYFECREDGLVFPRGPSALSWGPLHLGTHVPYS